MIGFGCGHVLSLGFRIARLTSFWCLGGLGLARWTVRWFGCLRCLGFGWSSIRCLWFLGLAWSVRLSLGLLGRLRCTVRCLWCFRGFGSRVTLSFGCLGCFFGSLGDSSDVSFRLLVDVNGRVSSVDDVRCFLDGVSLGFGCFRGLGCCVSLGFGCLRSLWCCVTLSFGGLGGLRCAVWGLRLLLARLAITTFRGLGLLGQFRGTIRCLRGLCLAGRAIRTCRRRSVIRIGLIHVDWRRCGRSAQVDGLSGDWVALIVSGWCRFVSGRLSVAGVVSGCLWSVRGLRGVGWSLWGVRWLIRLGCSLFIRRSLWSVSGLWVGGCLWGIGGLWNIGGCLGIGRLIRLRCSLFVSSWGLGVRRSRWSGFILRLSRSVRDRRRLLVGSGSRWNVGGRLLFVRSWRWCVSNRGRGDFVALLLWGVRGRSWGRCGIRWSSIVSGRRLFVSGSLLSVATSIVGWGWSFICRCCWSIRGLWGVSGLWGIGRGWWVVGWLLDGSRVSLSGRVDNVDWWLAVGLVN